MASAMRTDEPASLIAALARNVQQHPRRVAARERDRGIWVEHDWAALLGDVLAIAAGFETLGVQRGHAVMVIGDNRLRLYEAMLAAMVLRAFPAPIYPDVPPAELVHYSQLGRPDIAVAEDQEQVDKLLELRERNEGRPHTIVYHDPRGLVRYTRARAAVARSADRARTRAAAARAGPRDGPDRPSRAERHRRAAAFLGHDRQRRRASR